MKGLLYNHVVLLFLLVSFYKPVYLSSKEAGPIRLEIEYEDNYDLHISDESLDVEPISSNKLINLEERAQDFILEMKQIEIPGYPNSFNPAIVRWKGKLLLAFRIRNSKTKTTNQIGFVWLNENFDVDSQAYVLSIPKNPHTIFAKEQDPRLITISDRLYMIYSNIIPGKKVSEIRRVFITEVHFDNEHFFVDLPECLYLFEKEREERWEKNWVPFEYQGELLLAYSLNPHRILHLLGNGKCETCACSLGSMEWNWGVLRGGTPAILDEGQYLSFFHSTINMATVHSGEKVIAHYFMGAYTFSPEPPFAITKISSEPIVGNNFYSSPPYKTWKPLKVVFPSGLLVNEDYVWVSYGRQDFEMWIVKIDKKRLLKSLIPVTTIL